MIIADVDDRLRVFLYVILVIAAVAMLGAVVVMFRNLAIEKKTADTIAPVMAEDVKTGEMQGRQRFDAQDNLAGKSDALLGHAPRHPAWAAALAP